MLNRRRFVVGAALIAVAVSYLVWAGISSTAMYYFELDEFHAARAAHAGEAMRVKGWVRTGTMQWDPATNKLSFELARQDGSGAVPVAFQGILPDMFAEGREVVVEGHDEGAVFRARQVMTSCPSKYEADRKGA
jgi:cytochrome c-type biogenesis protein CcmE